MTVRIPHSVSSRSAHGAGCIEVTNLPASIPSAPTALSKNLNSLDLYAVRQLLRASEYHDMGARSGASAARRVASPSAEDVDLANGVIRVEFGWEYRDGQIPLKSNVGRRKVPILTTRFAESGYSGADRLFGFVSATSPFDLGSKDQAGRPGVDGCWA